MTFKYLNFSQKYYNEQTINLEHLINNVFFFFVIFLLGDKNKKDEPSTFILGILFYNNNAQILTNGKHYCKTYFFQLSKKKRYTISICFSILFQKKKIKIH